jgi:hypothetical protein
MVKPRCPLPLLRAPRRAQATTEYFLVIAVVVVGLVVAAYTFLPGFRRGVNGLRTDVQRVLTSGMSDGSGGKR